MIQRTCLFLSLILLSGTITAQDKHTRFSPLNPSLNPQKTTRFDPGRMVYGGNIGAWFGSDYTLLELSPLAGYKLNDFLVSGVGLTYMYARRVYSNGYVQKEHMYGVRPFARAYFADVAFVHAEYELLNREYYDFLFDRDERIWWGTPLAGLGYYSGGSGLIFYTSFLYAFNHDNPRSPYYMNPVVVRVGFIMR